jgi:hypothetical protein
MYSHASDDIDGVCPLAMSSNPIPFPCGAAGGWP